VARGATFLVALSKVVFIWLSSLYPTTLTYFAAFTQFKAPPQIEAPLCRSNYASRFDVRSSSGHTTGAGVDRTHVSCCDARLTAFWCPVRRDCKHVRRVVKSRQHARQEVGWSRLTGHAWPTLADWACSIVSCSRQFLYSMKVAVETACCVKHVHGTCVCDRRRLFYETNGWVYLFLLSSKGSCYIGYIQTSRRVYVKDNFTWYSAWESSIITIDKRMTVVVGTLEG